MISPGDLEQLSSFLDNRLNDLDHSRLETRLRHDPALRQELDELRRTRLLLRSLPKRKAPRNFTLTPRIVGVRPVSPPRPILGLVSAMATLLLIFFLIGDLLVIPEYVGIFRVRQTRPEDTVALSLPAPEAGEVNVVEEEELIFPTALPTPAETILALKEQPAAEAGPGEGGEVSPAATTAPPSLADTLPQPTEAELKMEGVRSFTDVTPTVEAMPAMAEDATSAQPVIETPEVFETLVVQTAPVETTEIAANFEQASAPPISAESQPSTPGLWKQVAFWMVELLLIFVAVSAGLIALYSHFKFQR
jgi:hypothetical protein